LAAAASPEEVEFRDGTQGVLTWAVATLLTAVLAFVGLSQNWMKLARELEHARALLDEYSPETETKKRA
jgi:hypothetical protein